MRGGLGEKSGSFAEVCRSLGKVRGDLDDVCGSLGNVYRGLGEEVYYEVYKNLIKEMKTIQWDR